MSAQIVHIEIGVGGARVGPKSFLGGEFFGSYRSACDAHGFKWDKVRGSASRNVGPKANVPALAAELSRRGFTVTMDDAAKAILLRASETGLTDAQLLAAEHVEAMEGVLKERGLSLWRPFQTDGAIFLNASHRALMADEMGCIAGEAIVNCNRAGRGFKISLADLCHKFNGGRITGGKYWDASIPTYIRSMCDGELRLNLIKKVLKKGLKPVVSLKTTGGKWLRLTGDHEVAMVGGGWTPADQLKRGDQIFTNGTWVDKDGYVRVGGLKGKHHRHTTGGVYQHIIVAEKMLGRKLKVTERVHHKNEIKHDNRPENLEVMTNSKHAEHHGKDGGYLRMNGGRAGTGGLIQFVPTIDSVLSVEPDGEAEVYDVVCADPHRNFVANGIVVHNCGKTIQILTALPVGAAVMVICPASVMVNWARECRKWRPEIRPVLIRKVSKREARYLAIDGIHVEEERRWPQHNEMVVYNYESSPTAYNKDEPNAKALQSDPVENTVLVGDEIHRVKNRKAAMTQRWQSLRDAVFAKGGRVWGASGTPMFNRPFDLSSILYGLGLFSDVFTSWKDFLRRMGGVESEWGIKWTGVIDPTVPTSLKRVMIRREKKDVMAFLPAKTYRTLTVDAGEALGKLGDELSDMLKARGVDLERLEAELARCQTEEELGQVWNRHKATIPFDQMSRLHALTSEMAFVGAQGLIEEYEEQGVPVVVFCVHKGPVEQIGAREGWTYITGDVDAMDRNRRVIDFQAGKYRGIALTIAAGGVGITLTKSSHVVFLSKSWSPAENRQAEDRCHRGGQQNAVLITSVVPDHPLTRRLNNLLGWKEQMHQDAIGAASLIKSMAETRKAEANAALARLDGDEERAKMAAAVIDSRVDVKMLLGRIPAGRYALDSALPLGHSWLPTAEIPDAAGEPCYVCQKPFDQHATHTVFWHLDKPEDGKWQGWAFLKVQRGPETGRFSTIRPDGLASPAAAAVLEKIAIDPRAASARYGHEIGECGVCGKALTTEASRRLGIGPVCLAKFQSSPTLDS